MVDAVRGSALEQNMLAQVSKDSLWTFVSTVAKDERMSGSPEEREAMRYVADTLRSWDVDVLEYEHDGYVSRPVRSRLTIQAPEAMSIDSTTHSFARSGNYAGEIVYVGNGDEAGFAGKDVAGKVVLIEGLATPGKTMSVEKHRAAGAIFINDNNLHQMIVTPVWGTPTPATSSLQPSILVISIRLDDGTRLKSWLERGPVHVEIEAEVETGWARLPIVVGTITGAQDPDHFVMLAGHIDSWFYGAIDNAAANATTLETMRILAAHRDQLRRGFRVVFWSGHSHGRYAGSTWYADNAWEDLYDHCVAYVNVDSTGAMQAVLYEEILAMPETATLAKDVIADLTGQTAEVNRVGRAGDQSFWGIGIPSVFMSLSRVPIETAPELSRAMGALTGRKKSGQAWFWHTEHDTLDKIDLDVLQLDTKIYLSSILRLINSPILPFDYAATLDEIAGALTHNQELAGAHLDLSTLITRAEALRAQLGRLNQRLASGVAPEHEADANQALVDLGRILIPLNYTEAGQFEHDLALHAPAVPLLYEMHRLTKLDPASDDYRFLRTQLRRRVNQIAFTLNQARRRVDQALSALGPEGER
ncbi:MAG TPA: M28 family metallopeptidase [Nitrolancea sp.]|nr:M28 family metallopeptidase [Nitrolancea sp.]